MLNVCSTTDSHGVDDLHVVAGDQFFRAMVWLSAAGELIGPVEPVDPEIDVGLVDGTDLQDARDPKLCVVHVGDVDAMRYVVMVHKDVFLKSEILGPNCTEKRKKSTHEKNPLTRPLSPLHRNSRG